MWDTIPSNFDFKFYPIIVCTAGGIILGIWQKLTNAVPDELDEVMKKVKKDKFYPYNKVLLLCILTTFFRMAVSRLVLPKASTMTYIPAIRTRFFIPKPPKALEMG